MACRTGCRTQDHASWGDCARAAHIALGTDVFASRHEGVGMTQKAWDRELRDFDRAAEQGIVPDTTKTRDIHRAVDLSNQYGRAYLGQGEDAFKAQMESN